MQPFQILPSTTSHKHEAILPTLDLFARLGFRDLDLNLNHIVERGADADDVRRALAANGQRASIVSGGWCDFFEPAPAVDRTFESVARQVVLARFFDTDRIRLFFGRLPADAYSPAALDTIAGNIRQLSARHPDVHFLFENHDGASSRPSICRGILERVNRPNVRMVFDPINFEHRGARTMDALPIVMPFVAHVHLKGYAGGTFCGFGEGEVDLVPAIRELIANGYRGAFTVEYEGPGDRTLRLFEGVRRAEAIVPALAGEAAAAAGGASPASS